ncbi:MAG: hypothetical protein NTU53_01515 [Planctomycetota bacterium]|nr:hypothetical protein [Planctomycetota bacterium]
MPTANSQPSPSDLLTQLIAFDADGRAICPADALRQHLRHDLLHHPNPPIDLLRRTKDFAKLNYADPHSPLAPEICLLLYYGCIAAALLRLNQLITHLPDDDLRNGLNWTLRQPWLDQETRTLFHDALAHLRSRRHLWRR